MKAPRKKSGITFLPPPELMARSSILDPRSSILDPRSSILDPRPSILGLDDRPYYESLPPEVEFLDLHPSLFFDRARKGQFRKFGRAAGRIGVRRRMGLREISLSFGQIKLAAHAVDQRFAFAWALRIAGVVAQTQRRMPEFVQDHESQVERRQRRAVAAQFREVAEVYLQREDVDFRSR